MSPYKYYSDRVINTVLTPLKDRIAKGGYIRNKEAIQICTDAGVYFMSKAYISDIFTVIMKSMVEEGTAKCVGKGYWLIGKPPKTEEIKTNDETTVFDILCNTRPNPAKLAYDELRETRPRNVEVAMINLCEKHGCTIHALLDYIKLKNHEKTVGSLPGSTE